MHVVALHLLTTFCNSVNTESPAPHQVLVLFALLAVQPAGRFAAFFSRCQHWSCVLFGWILLQWGQVVAFLHFSAHFCALVILPVLVAGVVALLAGTAFGFELTAAVSCIIGLLSSLICLACFSINSATYSSVAFTYSSATEFADACPLALAVVAS